MIIEKFDILIEHCGQNYRITVTRRGQQWSANDWSSTTPQQATLGDTVEIAIAKWINRHTTHTLEVK
jgi:hypothetical protein